MAERRRFLLQMAGWMGSGKSTLARSIASATGAVVLDHDTTKSAIMAAGVDHPPAGGASFGVLFALAADLLRQGQATIVGSAAAYFSVVERGLAVAAEAGAPYYFIECECPEELAAARIADRYALPSQVKNRDDAATVRNDENRGVYRPTAGGLVLDSSRPLAESMEVSLEYLATTAGATGPAVRIG